MNFITKMSALITLLLLFIFGWFSVSTPTKNKKAIETISDMRPPLVVIALDERDADAGFHGGFGSIIIKDADGNYLTLPGNHAESNALIATYHVGDTIK